MVTLTVDLAAGGQVSDSMEIQVTDLLIVSIGDSNASGEGNPIAEALTAKRWYDDRCHRSDISGHALAAKRLEESDPHTSVTFLSFACSGAKVLKGLVLYYRGIDTPVEGFLYRPEPQLKAIMMALCAIRNPAGNEVGCREDRRQVDALLISIGVNDLGFSSVIRSCANLETISNLSTDDLLIPGTWSLADHLIDVDLNDPDWWKKLASTTFDVGLAFLDELIGSLFQWLGNWAGSDYFECTEELDPLIDMNMASLWSHFDLLDMILDGQVGELVDELQNDPESYRWLPPEYRNELLYRYGAISPEMQKAIIPKAVYITSYPADLFHDANGYRDGCGNFAGVSHDEAEWIYRTGARLNRLIELNASKHRWYYVSGITEAFQNHGYCAGDDSYYIGLTESIWRQLGLDGTVHPNRQGHPQAALKVHELYTADKPSWEEQHLVQITLEAVRVIDNSEFGSAEKKVNIYISDRWLRLPPLLIQPTVATGDWVSLTDGTNDVSYSARLAYDEHVRIQTQTSIGGGIFYPPKCNRPDCAQIIPPTKLATDRTYSPDNGFGRSTPWCEQTSSSLGRYTLSCTASTSDADGSFDLRFRLSYTSLALFPGVITDPHQVVCGPYCDAGSSQSQYPELAAYTKAISDTAAVQTLLNNLASDRLTDGEYFDFGGANDRAYAMTVQPDGKIILAGETEAGGADGREAALIRLHSPGIVDESFGLDGRLLGGTAGDDGARAVAIDAEGRLVVVGYLKDANADWAIWRYHPDGSLDTSFGGAGYVTLDFGFGDDYALALAIQPDQRLLVAGHAADSSGGRDFAVARYICPAGSLTPLSAATGAP
ncbi:MAG TPA: hypothetical protein VNK95_10870 [Caldilineaceae bacterium]|nr:hypothetical protein [Caldilineaceae bacterium]